MKLRVRAEAIIFKRNRVLCKLEPYVCFPGGSIDPHESANAAAIRETFEEAGRKLTHPSVAHPPTTQLWAKGFDKLGKDYEGGFTYWMTGSAADLPVVPLDRHDDFEPDMDWHPVKEVIVKLKSESANSDWSDDVKVRIKILETHLASQKMYKEAESPLFKRSHLLKGLIHVCD